MAWPAVKRGFTQEKFRTYLESIKWGPWRPTLIVLHNTAAPTYAQWAKTAAADVKVGKQAGSTRIANLETYWWKQKGWSGCPHFVISSDFIWVMNPLTAPGVHSPSWNHLSIGIEMVADFSIEDDDSGPGLLIRNNAIFVTALLCETFGLDPHTAVKLHKDDKKTTHDCPGKDFAQDREKVIEAIAALMSGGEHDPDAILIAGGDKPKPAPTIETRGRVISNDNLNFRSGPGVNNEQIGSLPPRTELVILDRAKNGTTEWLRVRSPAGFVGWVAGRYVQIST